MFSKSKAWYAALTKSSKLFVWTIIAISSLSVVHAATGPNQPPAPTSAPTVVEPTKPSVETKTVTETKAVAFGSTTINDSNLDKDKNEIRTAGVDGVKTFTYEVTYENGVEKDKKLVKEEITTQPVAQVTAIGTKMAYVAPPAPAPKPPSNCDPNYVPCVPNVSYDLDCPDIGFQVTVVGSDHHRFDRDGDGYGCESY
jgi:hypothetical protein